MEKPDLNKPMFTSGFWPGAADLVKSGRCTDCATEIKEDNFRDELSKKEYSISGLCQKCQDEVFGV